MIAVVVDSVRDTSILDEIGRYRLVFFVNTKNRATKLYSNVKKRIKSIELRVNTDDEKLIEKIAVGVAREFAEYKERIHVWIGDKCVVY